MTRVALLVTHLMGTGHLVRILAIARALRAAGAAPTIISGGRPLAHLDTTGLDLVQLPPVSAKVGDYRTLRGQNGAPVGDDYLSARRDLLRATLAQLAPDLLVVELWPFGRRVLAAEFLAAIEAVPGVPVIGSVRDVLEPPSKPSRVEEALTHAERLAAILVHGDAALLPLAQSWPAAGRLGEKLRYTGYVAAAVPPPSPCPDTVLVSVGGGAIGRALVALSAQAARLSACRWHILVGGEDAAAVAASLGGPARSEPVRSDYRALLHGAAASVSLAGYNTAVDVAQSATPALLLPMEEGGEREQIIRAQAFAKLPGIETRSIGSLTPASLARAADRLTGMPRQCRSLDADGAARAAAAILMQGRC